MNQIADEFQFHRLGEGDKIYSQSRQEASAVCAAFKAWATENDIVLSATWYPDGRGFTLKITCKAEYKHRAEREKLLRRD